MIHDVKMDNMLNDIVSIFTKTEGVELVRLSGLLKRACRIGGLNDLTLESLDNILQKMKFNKIIDWKYVMRCPHCGEISYQIKDVPVDKLKICDTCQSMFIPKDNLYQSSIIL